MPLGPERHTRFWEIAARRLVGRLEEYNLKDEILIIDAPWAEEDEAGVPFGERHGRPIQEVSDNFSALTDILSDLGVARMPREVATSLSSMHGAAARTNLVHPPWTGCRVRCSML